MARLDEFDYVFPGHFMVNLENSVMVRILDALNASIAIGRSARANSAR